MKKNTVRVYDTVSKKYVDVESSILSSLFFINISTKNSANSACPNLGITINSNAYFYCLINLFHNLKSNRTNITFQPVAVYGSYLLGKNN
jgi:hypothetical protein